MLTIGVLALQGSFFEHLEMLRKFQDVKAIEVKKSEDLDKIDGIIIPGGESTAISKLLHDFAMFDNVRSAISNGLPTYGTCAGMILLANEIHNENSHLGVIDIKVKRNAYGSQINSFVTMKQIEEFGENEIPLVFIRAPLIEKAGENVKIICEHDGEIVAARQNNVLVTSFHPELTEDLTIYKYFIEMIKNAKV